MNYFLNNGFLIIDNFASKDNCKEIINKLKDYPIKLYEPFYNKGFGYGNLVNDPIFNVITENPTFKKAVRELIKSDYIINHIIINKKNKLIGKDVEWHQEMFNVNSFAPGYDVNDIDKLLQVYIPLTDENINNGGLKIIPKSHKLGVLKHTDIVNGHFSHKRAVDFDTLEEICKTHEIKDLNLKAGSLLLFNDLLIHGSGTNKSLNDRVSIVIGIRSVNKPLDLSIQKREISKRRDFIINTLKERVEKLENNVVGVGVKGREESWSNLFENLPWIKNINDINHLTIEKLLEINGHSISKTGNFTMKKWLLFVDELQKYTNYSEYKSHDILEIGCGAGALLKSFENDKNNIYGLDQSTALIQIAKHAIPKGTFCINQANNLNLNKKFDIVLSHSCFQYFGNFDYFNNVINQISKIVKIGGYIAITDVFNEEQQDKYIMYRKNAIGVEEYNKKYKDLKHFYITKSKFKETLEKYDFKDITFVDTGYDDTKNLSESFRFNVYFKK